jgi:hypothetical protein
MLSNIFDIDQLDIYSETVLETDRALDVAAGSSQESMPIASFTGCTPGTGKNTPC